MSEKPRAGKRMERHQASEPDGIGTTRATAIRLHPGRSGEWMDAAEMRQLAIEQLDAHDDARELLLDLGGLEHLDASALQVLLALRAELRTRSAGLHLDHVSPGLNRWFHYAGAEDLLAADQACGPAPESADAASAGKESALCAEL